MKVEIWSDIMCPFCYIGKRNYEAAIKQFDNSANIDLEWKSFQLDPNIPKKFEEKVNVFEYLAQRKGISLEQSKQMHENVLRMASEAGLQYEFDKAIVSNSFDAHRIIQLAKTKGLDNEAEECFFKAYFTDGKDLADHKTLLDLGIKIGLTAPEINHALADDEYAYRVNADVQEANNIGVTGVPFFVFDRKYAVSGAQPPAVFLQTLQKSYSESSNTNVPQ